MPYNLLMAPHWQTFAGYMSQYMTGYLSAFAVVVVLLRLFTRARL